MFQCPASGFMLLENLRPLASQLHHHFEGNFLEEDVYDDGFETLGTGFRALGSETVRRSRF